MAEVPPTWPWSQYVLLLLRCARAQTGRSSKAGIFVLTPLQQLGEWAVTAVSLQRAPNKASMSLLELVPDALVQ